MKYPPIYVAATSQHIGKTTSTLGLVQAISDAGIHVGYCKPVGQQFVELDNLQIDKDAILFSSVMGFALQANIHSPVILGPGATAHYIDNPDLFEYPKAISNASSVLEKEYELIVYEGTGHPGVGSVVNLSNAEVAKMLGAGVIMVVKGGIGNTLDKLHLSLSVFREKNVPILGVIVNKVIPEKLDKVKYYVGKKLKTLGLPLLGVVPYDKSLAYPLMATVANAVRGRVAANEHNLDNKVEDIVAGSLIDVNELKSFENLLLVVSINRLEDALAKISSITQMIGEDKTPLSGIIVTNKGELSTHSMNYINRHQIPLVRTNLDTYGSVVKVSRIEVKINTRTPWKVRKAVELIKENVDLELIFEEQRKLAVSSKS